MHVLLGVVSKTVSKLFGKYHAADASNCYSLEKVEFAERKAEETFKYVLDSYDVAKAEGKNVLQWLFAAIVGGIGITGTLFQNHYISVAAGTLFSAGWAALSAHRLIKVLNAHDIIPPGSEEPSLKTIIHHPLPEMRWEEVRGLAEGTATNRAIIEKVCEGVDRARSAMSWIPVWFFGTTIGISLIRYFLHLYEAKNLFIVFLLNLPR